MVSQLFRLVILAGIAFAAGVGGAHWQYKQDRFLNPVTQFVVLDMARLMQPIVDDETLSDEVKRFKARELSDELVKRVDAYQAEGVIVLDASAVVRVPDDLVLKP